jgi:hypothetical protein
VLQVGDSRALTCRYVGGRSGRVSQKRRAAASTPGVPGNLGRLTYVQLPVVVTMPWERLSVVSRPQASDSAVDLKEPLDTLPPPALVLP